MARVRDAVDVRLDEREPSRERFTALELAGERVERGHRVDLRVAHRAQRRVPLLLRQRRRVVERGVVVMLLQTQHNTPAIRLVEYKLLAVPNQDRVLKSQQITVEGIVSPFLRARRVATMYKWRIRDA